MGHLLDRFLFLMRSNARELKNNIEEDFIPKLRDKILKYSFEFKGPSGQDFEKRFQEYLNRVRQFWQESTAKTQSKSGKEKKENWKEEAYREYEKNFQDTGFQDFPEQILKYFKALEIEPCRDKELIKSQWKKLMRRYHPDLFNDNADKRKVAAELSARLTQAYQEIISYLGGK